MSIANPNDLRRILSENTLYEVEEVDGKLEYILDENGKKRICDYGEMIFKPKQINETCSFIQKGITPKYVEASSIRVIKSGQAKGLFDIDKTAYFTNDKLIDQNDNRILKFGDLLVNTTGVGTAGRVTAYTLDNFKHVPDSHICILRCADKYHFKYLLYNFAAIGFKALEGMAEGTGGQIELKVGTIKNITIQIPSSYTTGEKVYSSFELQQSIVKQLEEKFFFIDEKMQVIKKMQYLHKVKINQITENIIMGNSDALLYEVEENDGELNWKENSFGKKILICKISDLPESDEVSLGDTNYIEFKKGKNHYIRRYNTQNKGIFPLATGSAYNESIQYHVKPIDESDIIFERCISFNKDGDTTVFYRDYPFLMDRHHVAMIPSKKIFAKYLYYVIKRMFKKQQYGWGNNVANVEEVAYNNILIPKKYHDYSSYQLQQSIAMELDRRTGEMKYKINVLESMKKLLEMSKDKTLQYIFRGQ